MGRSDIKRGTDIYGRRKKGLTEKGKMWKDWNRFVNDSKNAFPSCKNKKVYEDCPEFDDEFVIEFSYEDLAKIGIVVDDDMSHDSVESVRKMLGLETDLWMMTEKCLICPMFYNASNKSYYKRFIKHE